MSPKNAPMNKKHVAHLARVRQQSLIIKYITIGIFVFVGALIVGGILYTAGFPPYQNVASVNGEKLTAEDFKLMVKMERISLIQQYNQTLQIAQMMGLDPYSDPSISNQVQNISSQLSSAGKAALGQQVINTMVDNALYMQEAEKLGIAISDEELDSFIKGDMFGYYPKGTPTPLPTPVEVALPTLNPTQLALVTITPTASPFPTFTPEPTSLPTATPTSGPAPTNTATVVPLPTATPYTLEGFEQLYDQTVENYSADLGIDEDFFRQYFFVMPLLRQKVGDALTADLKPEEEKVWARHILVATEDEANQLYERLVAGEDFGELAKSLSMDTGSGSLGGDLGWFGRGMMVKAFEDAAYSQVVGEIGKPVQSTYGYHIIQVLGRENRPLTDDEFSQLKNRVIADWLAKAREDANIKTYDFWKNIMPMEPGLQGQQ